MTKIKLGFTGILYFTCLATLTILNTQYLLVSCDGKNNTSAVEGKPNDYLAGVQCTYENKNGMQFADTSTRECCTKPSICKRWSMRGSGDNRCAVKSTEAETQVKKCCVDKGNAIGRTYSGRNVHFTKSDLTAKRSWYPCN